MDDYLFIVLAKLQADQLKLQLEQAQQPIGEPGHTGEQQSHRARRFDPGSEWPAAQLSNQLRGQQS